MPRFQRGDRVYSSIYGDWGVVRAVWCESDDDIDQRYVINFDRPHVDGYWIQEGYYALPDELTTRTPEKRYYLASPIFLEGGL